MKGQVLAVSISEKKGTIKKPVESIELVEDMGVKGDAHFGYKPRQVSILAWEEVEQVFPSPQDVGISFGAFAENIAIKGIHCEKFKVGVRLKIGDAELEITQIGKDEAHGGPVERKLGTRIMPTYGLFCKVLKGGVVRAGSSVVIL